MVAHSYWFTTRPPTASHQHPFLVFDCANCLHFELTVFARQASLQFASGTVRSYLYALLPFFTYLERDVWQHQRSITWASTPDHVRQATQDYLVQKLRCLLRDHQLGFSVVRPPQQYRSTARVFLSALKGFYRIMQQQGYYPFDNPLVDPLAATILTTSDTQTATSKPPLMPPESGLAPPKRRLSDSYFKLEGEEWRPQIVDDPALPRLILQGGRQLPSWGLREELVTRLLFETGARVSEVVGLTLGDYLARLSLQEATAFNKGSRGYRVKFLRFSHDTAKLLRRYFDTERRQHDTRGWTFDEYQRQIHGAQLDPYQIPLFLSRRRTAYQAKTYRERAWNPACQAAAITADVHQARHWYVTMAMRQIYAEADHEGSLDRRRRELIAYMAWKSGTATLEAYDHHLDLTRHAEIQDALFQHLASVLPETDQAPPDDSLRRTQEVVALDTTEAQAESDFLFLQKLGGTA